MNNTYVDNAAIEWTFWGESERSDIQSLNGNKCFHIPDTSYSYITSNVLPNLAFNKNDFTIEFWVYLTATPTGKFSILRVGDLSFYFNATNELYIYILIYRTQL